MSGCTVGESAGGGRALEAQGLVCARGQGVVGTGPQNIEATEIDGAALEVAGTSASTNEASTPRTVDPVPRVDGSDASARLPPEPPSTVAEFQPPEGLREIVAQALRDAGMVNGEYDDSDGQWIVETKTWQYDAAADAVLAALFEACEVREQWGVRFTWADGRQEDRWIYRDRRDAEEHITAIEEEMQQVKPDGRWYRATVKLLRSCQLITSPEPVSSTGEESDRG